LSHRDDTPRLILAEVLVKLRRGPDFGLRTAHRFTAEQEEFVEKHLRLWLDSWIVPQLEEVERRSFPPTDRVLAHFAQHRADAAKQREMIAEMDRLKKGGMSATRAWRQVLTREYHDWRREARRKAREEAGKPPPKMKPCRVCRGAKGLACAVCAGTGEESDNAS
jgi:hypothetical protein